MIESEKIHLSVADAEDVEEVRDDVITVGDVVRSLTSHPLQLITRWNWKAALLGSALRASFYFTVYKASRESWFVTMSAVGAEFVFRMFTSGVSGAIVQSFRRATPVWFATLLVVLLLPTFSHTVEYFVHYIQENWMTSVFSPSQNNARTRAFAFSVAFSVLSAFFNIFVMRHGVLLVGAGEETKSLGADLKQIPMLIVEFIAFLPGEIVRHLGSGKVLNALGIFVSFGLCVGFVFGVFRGKWSWGWVTAVGAWVVLFAFTLLYAAAVKIYNSRAQQ